MLNRIVFDYYVHIILQIVIPQADQIYTVQHVKSIVYIAVIVFFPNKNINSKVRIGYFAKNELNSK